MLRDPESLGHTPGPSTASTRYVTKNPMSHSVAGCPITTAISYSPSMRTCPRAARRRARTPRPAPAPRRSRPAPPAAAALRRRRRRRRPGPPRRRQPGSRPHRRRGRRSVCGRGPGWCRRPGRGPSARWTRCRAPPPPGTCPVSLMRYIRASRPLTLCVASPSPPLNALGRVLADASEGTQRAAAVLTGARRLWTEK